MMSWNIPLDAVKTQLDELDLIVSDMNDQLDQCKIIEHVPGKKREKLSL